MESANTNKVQPPDQQTLSPPSMTTSTPTPTSLSTSTSTSTSTTTASASTTATTATSTLVTSDSTSINTDTTDNDTNTSNPPKALNMPASFDPSIVQRLTPTKNLLAISSHVVHGNVGNDAIQFPLNLRHWNVDCIYTTNLSNHPGYRQFKGTKADADLVSILYTGLNDLNLHYDAAIVGYTASKENTAAVYEILKTFHDSGRRTRWIGEFGDSKPV
ncbi:unnamed protein product [Ambrosiozyma monospora]|uniref:Unnamed protein product n=1 Tax=Ambrosiozyma monospora TaxID=43982 RepID=A0ACB5T994_AMBMO|nr:unnamed protein product [Ambrosiozyma monospora]